MLRITLVFIAIFCTGILSAQRPTLEDDPTTTINLYHPANMQLVRVNENSGVESPRTCGSGETSVSPVALGASRTTIFRIYAVATGPVEEIDQTLHIESIDLALGENYFIIYPAGFDPVLTVEEYLEFHVIFAPQCHGALVDNFTIVSNAQNRPDCRYNIFSFSENSDGPQLSVAFRYFPDVLPNDIVELSALPSSITQSVPAALPGATRILTMDIRNIGNQDLIISDVDIFGPLTTSSIHPTPILVLGEPIPPGAQRFLWLELQDTECSEEQLGFRFFSNAKSECQAFKRTDRFRVNVINDEENCDGTDWPDEPTGGDTDNGDLTGNRAPGIFPTLVQTTAQLWFPTSEETDYAVIDLSGRTVRTGKLAPGQEEHRLNLAELRQGHYFLRVAGELVSFRFVKQ